MDEDRAEEQDGGGQSHPQGDTGIVVGQGEL